MKYTNIHLPRRNIYTPGDDSLPIRVIYAVIYIRDGDQLVSVGVAAWGADWSYGMDIRCIYEYSSGFTLCANRPANNYVDSFDGLRAYMSELQSARVDAYHLFWDALDSLPAGFEWSGMYYIDTTAPIRLTSDLMELYVPARYRRIGIGEDRLIRSDLTPVHVH